MATAIYTLCALTCLACAVLLYRGYVQRGVEMLLWSSLCFAGLTVSNTILVLDRVIYPMYDLSTARLLTALIGLVLLVVGLIQERP